MKGAQPPPAVAVGPPPPSPSSRTFDANDGYARRAAVLAWQGDPRPHELPDPPPTSAVAAARAACGGRAAGGCTHCGGPLRVLLVASSRRAGCWILPGGGIEPGESDEAAAVREAHEEGGIVPAGGCAQPPVWPLAIVVNDDKRTRTRLFALRVGRLDDGGYADAGARARTWATLPEAARLLAPMPAQARCLAAAAQALGWALPPPEAAGGGAGAPGGGIPPGPG